MLTNLAARLTRFARMTGCTIRRAASQQHPMTRCGYVLGAVVLAPLVLVCVVILGR